MLLSSVSLRQCASMIRPRFQIVSPTTVSKLDLLTTSKKPVVSIHQEFSTTNFVSSIPQNEKTSWLNKVELPGNSFLIKLYKKLRKNKIPKSLLQQSGYFLSAKCFEGAIFERFLEEFDMPDTYYSWFLVSELHVWMLTVRLMAGDTSEGKHVRKSLVEALWVVCNEKMSSMGGISPSDKKANLDDIYEEFLAATMIYDLGILGDDKELSNAIWRRFFSRAPPDFEKIEILTRYVRENVAYLETISLNDLIMNHKVDWKPLQVK